MDDSQKIQELGMIEQNLQSILFQKQAFEMELDETLSAIREVEKTGEEVYKVIGQIMIKTEKSRIKSELSEKKKILELRIVSLDKQNELLEKKLEKIRKELEK